jgi:hypothetical protein
VRCEVVVLRTKAHFDRVALESHFVLREGQQLALRDTQLPLDEIEPRNRLGDRVLDLQPRVHLHQEEVAALEQELHRARADISRRLRQLHRAAAHALAQQRVDGRTRRLFDDLLVAPLHRTIALPQVNAVPVRIGEHLHLDVARRQQRLLQQQLARPECRQRFRTCALDRRLQLRCIGDEAHAPPATAGGRLHHHRITDARGLAAKALAGLILPLVARQARHAARERQFLGGRLVAQCANRLRRRPDPHQARIDHGLREVGVLAEESIARVDRIGARRACRVQQLVDAQVSLRGGVAVQCERPPRLLHVQRAGIRIRVNGHGGDAHAMRGTDHAARDLAAIGDDEAADRRHRFALIARKAASRCP